MKYVASPRILNEANRYTDDNNCLYLITVCAYLATVLLEEFVTFLKRGL